MNWLVIFCGKLDQIVEGSKSSETCRAPSLSGPLGPPLGPYSFCTDAVRTQSEQREPSEQRELPHKSTHKTC